MREIEKPYECCSPTALKNTNLYSLCLFTNQNCAERDQSILRDLQKLSFPQFEMKSFKAVFQNKADTKFCKITNHV